MVEPDSPQTTIWRMRIACCIAKATDELIAVPWQEWLRERS